ncbi:hypothetical protein LTR05_002564 [Lithohypha guttulata]|uniref:Uncharacterized protein n=1 Tax=Lithohypha guttulata TaxID=1690604 RepID=A0AAN7T2G2_9EURO|nr:hypothetical protein LTR05_002564 [Lithohypha guttulata]
MSNQDSDKIDTGVIKHDAFDKMFCEPEGPTQLAYKAADRLMMTDLQNELVSNDLRMLRNHDMRWTLVDVFGMGKLELDHTPYYQLILKSAVHAIMAMPPKEEIANEEITKLSDCPSAMADVLRHINKYNRKPWQHVETGDWCEYHIHANGNKCNAAKS